MLFEVDTENVNTNIERPDICEELNGNEVVNLTDMTARSTFLQIICDRSV